MKTDIKETKDTYYAFYQRNGIKKKACISKIVFGVEIKKPLYFESIETVSFSSYGFVFDNGTTRRIDSRHEAEKFAK